MSNLRADPFVQALLDAWKQGAASPMATYEPGTWGPADADLLMARDGRVWRD